MLSTLPPPTRYLAPRPSGALICLRAPIGTALSATAALAPLRSLDPTMTFGIETWPREAHVEPLLLIWCMSDLAPSVMRVLRPFGDPIDWPGRLPFTGVWQFLQGLPHMVEREYDAAAAIEARIPDWLLRMQQEAA